MNSVVEGIVIAVGGGIVLYVLGAIIGVPKRIYQWRVSRRVFVPDTVTPAFLDQLRDNQTKVAGDLRVQPYRAKWMRIAGEVSNVEPTFMSYTGGHTITVILRDADRHISIFCDFSRRWSGRLEVMPKGTPVRIVGRLHSIESGYLKLTRCELVEG